jgi:hypothetical protein
MQYDFGANPSLRGQTVFVGLEQQPVILVDDLMCRPLSLVDYAATEVQFKPLKHDVNYYPGVRAPVPQQYLASLYDVIKPMMRDTFGLAVDGQVKATCSFSMVTVRPERLNLFQRLPHFDTVDPGQIAVLHYLCDPSHGGTAFYRHRSTGFESITQERLTEYLERLKQDIDSRGPPPARYVVGDDERFECIESFAARFDRVLIYRSQMLHSGSISPTCNLTADPRTGRLTANAFFYIRS